ncbi:hypothetical protein CP965_03380 [Halarcobacter mediterraneus]|uniref:DUF8051 domain-containing protein n=1 Tax=Halarcobacter mediterraneus TaxID=2023153 RepID=A0A4Q1AWQ4_9BACT|nr:hypothetical protein [Halarcobacter mediterraneus]RXK14505.1 hypothetical protein CP965_03380 [Halarcobacter mediterraneus]
MLRKNLKYIIATCLISLSILLTILVPGGPIETRDFSHYDIWILSLFNIFLTSLGIISIITAFLIIKQIKYSISTTIIISLLYIFVYLSDLFKIFPISNIPMSNALFTIEFISTIIAISLLYLCIKYDFTTKENNSTFKIPTFFKILLILIIFLFSIAIILFATNSAMGN